MAVEMPMTTAIGCGSMPRLTAALMNTGPVTKGAICDPSTWLNAAVIKIAPPARPTPPRGATRLTMRVPIRSANPV
ncbi:MAG: hypothetical protein BWY83_03424 [bacterium ADurb.Bin478]|nr:MAG: hypothetical protein BWY83_03424 [bacterium ADurb.Bin478]